MGISDRLTTIRQHLPGAAPPPEDEKLLQLYWNRAELKKEVTRLQDERHKLIENHKKQEGIAARMRDHLDQLEDYLGNPEVAQHALIYFQLRNLWRTGAARLAQFSKELQAQQEEREQRAQRGEFEKDRAARILEGERILAVAQANAEMLEAQLKLLEARLHSMRGFWNYFRRRSLASEIDIERSKWDIAATQVTDLSDDQAARETASPPRFPGISVEGRRMVNLALIAYSQQLVASLSQGGLAMLAKETTARRAFDVRYGGRDDCARLMALLREAVSVVSEANAEVSGSLRQRIESVRANAAYRDERDTVPAVESIGSLPVPAIAVPGLEMTGRTSINVLVDDYWNLSRALLS
jgi:chorismate mutase